MTLQIFNPEHDIALAANLENFTAPHAGRQLRHDLGFLPALWASADDCVLVDDVELAQRTFHRLSQSVRKQLGIGLPAAAPRFIKTLYGGKLPRYVATTNDSEGRSRASEVDAVNPWGWDLALRAKLRRMGMAETLLPTDTQLDDIRQLSHRRTSARLLPLLQGEGTVGEAFECTSIEEVTTLLQRYGNVVLKAPWSSSGRGVRFVGSQCTVHNEQLTVHNSELTINNSELTINDELLGWLRNLLLRQGSVMVEPYYNKVKDFGMEFEATADGQVHYLGLSLFHTANGAYTGNILATEDAKREIISRYLPLALLDHVCDAICHHLPKLLNGRYTGPLGIDMMIVHNSQFTIHNDGGSMNALHPCVEINLRRTMGHVALTLTPKDDDIRRVMRVEYANNNYQLKIQRL